ncbi:MAG: hypothetical protein WC959_06070 [Kiritimatiellales bacterium]
MKKLTLLCTRASRETTLDALRDLGVVHLTPVQPPAGNELDKARETLASLKRVLTALSGQSAAHSTGMPVQKIIDAVHELISQREVLTEQIDAQQQRVQRYQPFGSFSPETIRSLEASGVYVTLAALSTKDINHIPDDIRLVELSRTKGTVYAALISREKIDLDITVVLLPEESLDDMKVQLEQYKSRQENIRLELEILAADRAAVAEFAAAEESRIRYLEARAGMGDEKDILYLYGFFPVRQEEEISAAAGKNGWAVLVEEPAADDPVPTLLTDPKWMSLIKPVYRLIDVLPGYDEVDISGLFLVFLSIFYAFIVGDAGYGLLFITASLWAKFKFKKSRIAQMTVNLLILMSSCTVIWGVMNGSWFGIDLQFLPKPLQHITLPWLLGGGDADLVRTRVMLVCFTIGAIHLSIAHGWNLIRKLNSPTAVCDLGWLFTTWAFYFLALNLVIGIGELNIVLWTALGIGAGLITLGTILIKNYTGLITLALDIVGNFTDIISYVRLYAVGAASLAIAQAFNNMGADVNGALPVVVGQLCGAFVIFIGHALNITLAALSVLVHGIRLNTLEFSNHVGVQWGGVAYQPFRKD